MFGPFLKGRTVAVVLVFLLLSGAELFCQQNPSSPDRLKVVVGPYMGYAPFFIATEMGYFREQNIEVEYINEIRHVVILPALLQGDVDVMASTLSFSLLNAIARGGVVKIVGDKGYIDPDGCVYLSLLAPKSFVESGRFDDAAGIRGVTIATQAGTTLLFYVEHVLNTFGLTVDDVTNRYLPAPVRHEALKNGAVDLINAVEPWLTRILAEGDTVIWKPANEVAPNMQLSVIMYGPNLLENEGDVGGRFMTAYLKGVRRYNLGKTNENIAILSKYLKVEPRQLREICWPSFRSDGMINVKSITEYQEWGMRRGMLDEIIPQERFFEDRYVRYANDVLGTPIR
jgi:NitT/TauT family transport system substrate-binding protein